MYYVLSYIFRVTTLMLTVICLYCVCIYSVERPQFAHTRQSLVLLESVSRCAQQQESVLLVGETGVGKTALVSYLASVTGM